MGPPTQVCYPATFSFTPHYSNLPCSATRSLPYSAAEYTGGSAHGTPRGPPHFVAVHMVLRIWKGSLVSKRKRGRVTHNDSPVIRHYRFQCGHPSAPCITPLLSAGTTHSPDHHWCANIWVVFVISPLVDLIRDIAPWRLHSGLAFYVS